MNKLLHTAKSRKAVNMVNRNTEMAVRKDGNAQKMLTFLSKKRQEAPYLQQKHDLLNTT